MLFRFETLNHQWLSTVELSGLAIVGGMQFPAHWNSLETTRLFNISNIGYRIYAGFLKWGYLQIIHSSGIFPYKQSILGYPQFRKLPYKLNNKDSSLWHSFIHNGETEQIGLRWPCGLSISSLCLRIWLVEPSVAELMNASIVPSWNTCDLRLSFMIFTLWLCIIMAIEHGPVKFPIENHSK